MIVALHEGKVVEQGSHEELMQKKGHYFNLVMAQTSPEKLEGNTILLRISNLLGKLIILCHFIVS